MNNLHEDTILKSVKNKFNDLIKFKFEVRELGQHLYKLKFKIDPIYLYLDVDDEDEIKSDYMIALDEIKFIAEKMTISDFEHQSLKTKKTYDKIFKHLNTPTREEKMREYQKEKEKKKRNRLIISYLYFFLFILIMFCLWKLMFK